MAGTVYYEQCICPWTFDVAGDLDQAVVESDHLTVRIITSARCVTNADGIGVSIRRERIYITYFHRDVLKGMAIQASRTKV